MITTVVVVVVVVVQMVLLKMPKVAVTYLYQPGHGKP